MLFLPALGTKSLAAAPAAWSEGGGDCATTPLWIPPLAAIHVHKNGTVAAHCKVLPRKQIDFRWRIRKTK